MTKTTIPRLTADDSTDDLAEALDRSGCLVVSGMAGADALTSVVEELAPHMDATPITTEDDPEAFYPGNTRRVTALGFFDPRVENEPGPTDASLEQS